MTEGLNGRHAMVVHRESRADQTVVVVVTSAVTDLEAMRLYNKFHNQEMTILLVHYNLEPASLLAV